MKKRIYHGAPDKKDLFDIKNFALYMNSQKETAQVTFDSRPICGYGSAPVYLIAVYHVTSKGVTVFYEKHDGFKTPTSVILFGRGNQIGGVEKKILKDAAEFKENRKRTRDTAFGLHDFDDISENPDETFE